MSGTEEATAVQQTSDVTLPDRLVSRVADRLPYTEFDSPDEYVAFVLEEVLYHVEEDTDEAAFDADEQEEVEERLESLGYMGE